MHIITHSWILLGIIATSSVHIGSDNTYASSTLKRLFIELLNIPLLETKPLKDLMEKMQIKHG